MTSMDCVAFISPLPLRSPAFFRFSARSSCRPTTPSVWSRRLSPLSPRCEGSTNPDDNIEPGPVETTRIPELEALDPDSGSVVIKPTFNLAGGFLFTGGFLVYLGDLYAVLGLPLTIIGAFLAIQSANVRFLFGPSRFSIARRKAGSLEIVVGWEYEQMTNWEVWWKPFPILTYFKESESYNGRGSIHFFPILCDGAQLVEQLLTRTPHIDKPQYK